MIAISGFRLDDRIGVHLLDHDAPVFDPEPRNNLQSFEERRGPGPVVHLHESDDKVSSALQPAVSLFEHLEGLANSGRHPEVDAQPSAALG